MADQKIMMLGGITIAALLVGVGLGSFTASQVMNIKKERAVIKNSQIVYAAPSHYAQRVDFSFDRKEMPLIIEKLDYKKMNKGKPSAVYLRNNMSVTEESTKKQFELQGNRFYKVVAYPEGENLKIQAKTDKNDTVELTLAKVDVTLVDEGVWNKIRFKDGSEGWLEK